MLREKWVWDTSLRRMVKVMAIEDGEDPMTIFVKVDNDASNKIDGTIIDELDDQLLGTVNYEIKCPQCQTTTKIIGNVEIPKIQKLKTPSFKCPDCHVEIPLLIRKGAV